MARSRNPRGSLSNVASMVRRSPPFARAGAPGRGKCRPARWRYGDPGCRAAGVIVHNARRSPTAAAPARRRSSPFPAHSIGAGGEIKPDGLWIRRRHGKTLAAQPGGKLPPIGFVGAPSVSGAGIAGVILGLFPKSVEMGEAVRGTITSEASSSSTSIARDSCGGIHANALCLTRGGTARLLRPSESVIRILIGPELKSHRGAVHG